MKLHLPFSLRRALLLTLLALPALCPVAESAVMHSDVSMATYTDFGQNKGRYVVANQNALLQHLSEGGVSIPYTNGQAAYTLPHGMVDFTGIANNGASTAIGYNYVATVAHNGAQNPLFSSKDLDSGQSIRYYGIEYRYAGDFRLTPAMDYKITRLSKLVTDVSGATLYSGATGSALVGQTLYRAGSGTMYRENEYGELAEVAPQYSYIIGGVDRIESASGLQSDKSSDFYSSFVWNSDSLNAQGPLPFHVQPGDSGSPVYLWNEATGSYEYIGAEQSMSYTGNSIATTATQWTQQTMERDTFNCRVILGGDNLLRLSDSVSEAYTYAGNNDGTAVSGTTYTRWLYNGTSSSPIAYLSGNNQGVNTWNDLSPIKDTEHWYNYDNSYLNASVYDSADKPLSYGDLFYTQNLIVTASSSAQQTVQVEADTDLGLGYVQLTRTSAGGEADYVVKSVDGQSYVLNSAGYVVDEGVTVRLRLTNPADYVREWRKVGEGTLIIEGSGNNEVLLNVGGRGKTQLSRSEGYAAYNVLANNGATVVIDNIDQIARDFTFGYHGGVLDMNGQSMTWDNGSTDVSAQGFTIHALDEGAIITNNAAAKTTLTWMQADEQTWLGSFTDSANGALEFIYNGGGKLMMHSIRTDLTKHADSGLTVQSGTLALAGTNTVHALGSLTGTDTQRYSNPDDWHYADTAAKVTVKQGATFELGSHARLQGNVVVESGGSYVMREGVTHQMECIEGGYALENTDSIRQFFGLHGNVELASAANMHIAFNEGADSTLVYTGNITGAGNVSVAAGTQGGVVRLEGTNTFSGSKSVSSGGLYAASNAALGNVATHKWVIGERGWLASDGFATVADIKTYVDASSAGVLALTQNMAQDVTAQGFGSLIVGAAAGKEVHYGTSTAELAAVDGKWTLGGGGGNLIVDFKLAGNNQLVLGNEYGSGNVHLTNTANSFTGGIAFAGGVTLTYVDGALGGSTLALSYGNRAMLAPTDIGKLDAGAQGTLLVDRIADKAVDLSPQPGLYLGAAEDVTYSGAMTLGAGESYRFGGSSGRLTVSSALESGRHMVIDGQGWTGGSVVFTQAQAFNGNVTVKGYDSALTTGMEGDATLSFAADNAMANVAFYTVQAGGIIDLAGTKQTLHNLNVSKGGSVSDSTGGATLTLTTGSVTEGGVLDVGHIVKEGSGLFTMDVNSIGHFDTLELKGGTLEVFSPTATTAGGTVIVHGGAELNMRNNDASGTVVLHDGAKLTKLSGLANLTVSENAHASMSMTTSWIGAIDGTVTLGAQSQLDASIARLSFNGQLVGSGHADFAVSYPSTSASVSFMGNNLGFTGRMGFVSATSGFSSGIITIYFENYASFGAGTVAFDNVYVYMKSANSANNAVRATLEIGSGGAVLNDTSSKDYYFGGLTGSGALKTNLASGSARFRGDVRGFSGTLDRNGTAASTFTYGFGGSGLSYREVTGSTTSGPIRLFADSDSTQLVSSGSATLNYEFQYADAVVLNATVSGAANVKQLGTGTLVLSENNSATGTLTIGEGGRVQFGEGGETGSWAGAVTGAGTLVNRNTSAAGVSLNTSQNGSLTVSTFSGSLDLMQGTKLTLTTPYTLGSGERLLVAASESAGSGAELDVRYLVLSGGSLEFSGEALGSEAALKLTQGVVARNTSVTTQTITLYDTSHLSAGTYKLVSGNWATVGAAYSVSGVADYFSTSVNAANDGLYLTVSAVDNAMVWGGTETQNSWSGTDFGSQNSASAGKNVYFTDAAQNKSVSISGEVAADALVFNAQEDYVLAVGQGGSLSASRLELMTSGKVTLDAGVTISGATTLAKGSEVLVKNFATLGGAVSGAGTLSIDAGSGEGSETLSGVDSLRLVSGRYNVTSAVGASTIAVEGGQLYIRNIGSYTNDIELGQGRWQGGTDAASAAALRIGTNGGDNRVMLSGQVTLTEHTSVAVDESAILLLQSKLVGNGNTLTVKGANSGLLWLDTASSFAADNVSFVVESGTLRLGGTSSKGLLEGITAISAAKGATVSFLGSTSSLDTAFTLEGGSSLELTATNTGGTARYDFDGDMQLNKAADGTEQANITSSAGRDLALNGLISGEGGLAVTGNHDSALSLTLNNAENSFAGGISVADKRSHVTINLASAAAAGTGDIVLGNASAQLNVTGNTAEGATIDVMRNDISGSGQFHLVSGRLELAGQNGYTGNTSVAQGATLRISAEQSGSAQYAMSRNARLEVAASGSVTVGENGVGIAAAASDEAVLENVTVTSSSLSVTEALFPSSVQGARLNISATQYCMADLELRDSAVVAAVAQAQLELQNVRMTQDVTVKGSASATDVTRLVAENLSLDVSKSTEYTEQGYNGGTAHVYSLATFDTLALEGALTLNFVEPEVQLFALSTAARDAEPDYVIVDFGDSVNLDALTVSMNNGAESFTGQSIGQGRVVFAVADGGVQGVPEPTGSALALLGLVSFALRRRRK